MAWLHELCCGCKLDFSELQRQVCRQTFIWALIWSCGCKLDVVAAASNLKFLAGAAIFVAPFANLTPIQILS